MIAWRLGARISSPQLYQKDVIGTPDTMRSVARWILERLASWDKESSRGKWSVGVWGVLECRVLNASLQLLQSCYGGLYVEHQRQVRHRRCRGNQSRQASGCQHPFTPFGMHQSLP